MNPLAAIRRRSPLVASGVVMATFGASLWLITRTVDGEAVRRGARDAAADPGGWAVVAVALLAAFSLRAVAWVRVLDRLSFAHSLSAIHVALGANHLLPLRLGETTRVLSVLRRTDVDPRQAVTSTVALRAGDIVSLLVVGAIAGTITLDRNRAAVLLAGPGRLDLWWMPALVLVVATAVFGRRRIRSCRPGAALAGQPQANPAQTNPGQANPAQTNPVRVNPGLRLAGWPTRLVVIGLVTGAWLAEAIVVWQVARWFGVDLGPAEALVVLAAAVSSQVFAVAPGGFGTYEASATAALLAFGVDGGDALALAVGLHATKTLYSLGTGAAALALPGPSILGRLRLPQTPDATVAATTPVHGSGGRGASDDSRAPIVLFLPAHNEAPRIEAVIQRAPAQVLGHPVAVLVVDDGSEDATATVARTAGAVVIEHETNRGLGAAVRTGLAEARARGAVAVAFCDADGEYDPASLEDLVAPILDGTAQYVVGSRFTGHIEHMRPHRRAGNLALTALVRWITRVPVTDGQSGYRAFSADAADAAEIAHDYNYAQVLTIDLVNKGFGYTEVPIRYGFRTSGRSFIRLGRYLAAVMPTIWRQLNPGRVAPPVTSAAVAAPAGLSWPPTPSRPMPSTPVLVEPGPG